MNAVALLLTLVTLAQAPVSAGDVVTVAADGSHVWFVQPALAPAQGFELCHHSTAFDGPLYKVQATLPQRPAAMAASGDRLWMVLAPSDDSAESRREVFSLQVQFNAAFGTFYTLPPGRLDPVAALPGRGRLASFITAEGGPVALIVPSPRSEAELSAGLEQARLLRQMNNQWIELALPEGLNPRRPILLGSIGADGSTLVLLEATTDSHQTLRYELDSSNQWRQSAIHIDLRNVLSIARTGGQLAAAVAGRGDATLEVALVRSNLFLPVAKMERPKGPIALLGLEEQPAILCAAAARTFTIRSIDLVTGVVSQPQELVDQPMNGQQMWQAGLVVMAVVAGVLMLFAIKPLVAPPAPLPRGVVLMAPLRRLAAVLIDLSPGALISMVVLRASPADLLRAPIVPFDLEHLGPGLLMIAITIVLCAIGELIWSTTSGKRLMGGEIQTMDLMQPKAGRVVVRNLMKGLVLFAPPLGLVVLLNPHMQGLEDVVGRTLVVMRASRQPNEQAPSVGDDAQ